MGLQAEPPGRLAAHKLQGQLLPRGALPAGLQQQRRLIARRAGLGGHGFREVEILAAVDHQLEFMAALQQLPAGRLVRFGGEGDPLKLAAEGIHAAGLQVSRQGGCGLGQGGAEGIEIVVQRFTAGDHHKSRSLLLGAGGRCGHGLHLSAGMRGCWPGVLGVTPAAAHGAAPQAQKEGAAACMHTFPLNGVEAFHQGKHCVHTTCERASLGLWGKR